MPLCKARHCDKYLYFACEKRVRFYRPYRCGEKAIKGEKLCEGCKNVVPSTRSQTSRGFNHGLVGEAYPPESHSYGSIWYLKQVAKHGEPSKETLTEATEYLDESLDITAGPGMSAELFRAETRKDSKKMPPKAKTATAGAGAGAGAATSNRVKKPKKTPEVEQAEAPAPKSKSAPAPKSKSAPTYIKESTVSAAKVQRENATCIIPRFVEIVAEPFDVCDVDVVDVATFTLNGSDYYRNMKTNDIYEMLSDKGMGPLIGLYDEDEGTIEEYKEDEISED